MYFFLDPKMIKKKDNYFKEQATSLGLVLARMSSCDGVPFAVFCKSIDLRVAIESMGLKERLPNSNSSIRKIVVEYSRKIRTWQIQNIQNHKIAGEKFCLIFDEWTSTRNRRYLNIVLKSQASLFLDVGFIRIKGSFTSEMGLNLIQERLISYGLSLKQDIIAIVTDGCSVMTKMGKLSPTEQQLCLAHGIHLSVMDVLYPISKKNEHDFFEIENEDEDEYNDDDDAEEGNLEILNNLIENDVSNENLLPIICKVRKIVKLFRKSPLKNETLQRHVLSDYKREYKLILDSKTRWSSLLFMVERFNKLKNCILKALIDLNSNILMDDCEFKQLNDLIEALQPLKLTVEALCRRDSTLLTADAVLWTVLSNLKNQNTKISIQLYESLENRIAERRRKLSSLFQYLHTGKTKISIESKVFETMSRNMIAKMVRDFILRLYPDHEEPQNDIIETDSNPEEINLSQHPQKLMDFQQALDQAIKHVDIQAHIEKTQIGKTLWGTLNKEMTLFESGGARGHHLQLIYEHLKSISPTSVESERAFSSSGYICNKIRSSLNDDTLEELCFLRSYFKLQKNDKDIKND